MSRFNPAAKATYQPFPLRHGPCGWQVQHICEFLVQRGFQVARERKFPGLTNRRGTALPVDISFRVDGHWAFIEFNGVHHYLPGKSSYPNVVANMQAKRQWCLRHQVPILEIPFWWANQLDQLVGRFLRTMVD